MQCKACERPISPGEMIVRFRYRTKPGTFETRDGLRRVQRGYGHPIGFRCKGCQVKLHKARRYEDYEESEDPFHGLSKRQCAYCDRVIWNYSGLVGPERDEQHRYRPYDLCSEQCRKKLRNINRRINPMIVTCRVCGELFNPKRRDAKTCGPACRQRLRRAQARVAA